MHSSHLPLLGRTSPSPKCPPLLNKVRDSRLAALDYGVKFHSTPPGRKYLIRYRAGPSIYVVFFYPELALDTQPMLSLLMLQLFKYLLP